MPAVDRRKRQKKRKRKTKFIKGYQPWNKNVTTDPQHAEGENNDDNGDDESHSDQLSNIPIPLMRVEQNVYNVAAQQYNGPVNTVPTKLRPEKRKEENKETLESENSTENIVVNFSKLKEFIKICMQHKCRSLSDIDISIAQRKGLCISLETRCRRCSFTTNPRKIFLECENKRTGPAAGCLNEGLSLATLKTKMGASDIQMALSCMDIKAPSLSAIKRKINVQCDKIVELSEQSLLENQEFVRTVSVCLGHGDEIQVETDTSYNNRNQAGYEAATQSFSPVIEKVTGLHLPISMATANKLCSKESGCNHDNGTCSKTYRTEHSISCSEAKLAERNLQRIKDQNIIKIKSVTSDASAQLGKVVREFGEMNGSSIQYYQCFVHRMRTVQKNVKNIHFSKLPSGYDKEIFRQKLSTCIRSRVRLELVRRHKSCSEQNFASTAQSAVRNIVPCFSGNHTNCPEKSLVCCDHMGSFDTKFLPYGKYLNLCVEEKEKLEAVLNKCLSMDVLNKISNLHTTNQCESLHHRVFTYAPKSVLYKRNFHGLCHSACHSATFGTGKSSVLLAKSLGLNFSKFAPFYRFMIRKDILALYHAQRKKTSKYKIQRFLTKCRKSNRRIRQGSMYTDANTELAEIHNYGINVNN